MELSEYVRCPATGCGALLRRPPGLAGRKVRCPRCSGAFRLPAAAPTPVPLPAPTPAPDAGDIEATIDHVPQSRPAPADGGSVYGLDVGALAAEVPRHVGPYELLRPLGGGAFGAVYLAYDRRLEREVALKLLRPGALGDADDGRRGLDEARAAARLRHPRIVPVFEAGEADGRAYIAAAYVEGPSLARAIADGRFDDGRAGLRKAVALVRDLADALAYAHTLGVVHRDVKPANIVLDDRGRPHLVDFGLAVRRDLADDGPRQLVGTPRYMAPEQARGAPSTARGDQYSLGVILYELLCGRVPLDAPNLPDLLRRLADDDPPPPRSVRPAVPAALESICLRALGKAPADRYPDCNALADDLRRWLRRSGASPLSRARLGLADGLTRLPLPHHRGLRSFLGVAVLLLIAAALAAAVYLSSRELIPYARPRPPAASGK